MNSGSLFQSHLLETAYSLARERRKFLDEDRVTEASTLLTGCYMAENVTTMLQILSETLDEFQQTVYKKV